MQGEVELLAELLANVEWQQFVGVQGIEPRKTLDGLAAQRALRLRSKAKQLQVRGRLVTLCARMSNSTGLQPSRVADAVCPDPGSYQSARSHGGTSCFCLLGSQDVKRALICGQAARQGWTTGQPG